MQTSNWSNRSGSIPLRCQWNPQWAREQQHRNQQFTDYHKTQQQFNFNENYWCETCDRGFPTQNLLDKHNQQHQKCNIDGCQFVAHPKMITKHIQMQHSTGLFKKIANLNKPEDIQKWITERKKNYPTKINIERKAAGRKEKFERGEKIGLQQSSKNDNFRHGADRKRKLFDGGKKYNQKINKTPHQIQNVKKVKTKNVNDQNVAIPRKDPKPIFQDTEDSKNRKLKNFTGIRNLIMDSENEEDNEEGPYLTDDDDEELQETAKIEPKVCDALSSLITNYDDSSEEEVETTKELNAIAKMECKEPESQNISLEKKSNKSNESVQDNECNDDDSGPEEVKNTKDAIEIVTAEQENNSNQEKIQRNIKIGNDTKHNKRKNFKPRVRPKPPSTLLHKLLHREIRQERNIILQCITYIVKHNFFDKP